MKSSQYTRAGSYHVWGGTACQDRLLLYEDKYHVIAVVADGVSACSRAAKGAEVACEAVKDFFLMEGERIFDYPDEKIAYLLNEHILFWLEKQAAADSETNIQEYASTIAAGIMKKKNGKTLAVGLGDCAVFELDHTEISPVILPRRFHGRPCQVTTENAYRVMSIQRLELGFSDTLFLCTDGFLDVWNENQRQGGAICSLVTEGNYEGLNEKLEKTEHMDDCTYLAVLRTR